MKMTENSLNELKQSLMAAKVAARFGQAIIAMAEELTKNPRTAYDKALSEKHVKCDCSAALRKYSAGKINVHNEHVYVYAIMDGDTQIGTAIWEPISKVSGDTHVCSFIKLDGVEGLFAISAPNPAVTMGDKFNWCMALLVDLTVMSILGREAQ